LRSQAGDEKKREMKQKKLKKAKPAATRNGRMPWERKPFAKVKLEEKPETGRKKLQKGGDGF